MLSVALAVLVVAACSVLSYELLWGRLFPFSPVTVWFQRADLPRVVLYTQNSDTYGRFRWVDALAGEAEASHALTFRAKPKLFFFGDAGAYARRASSKARARTFPNGAIVVSPWVQREDADGTLSLRIYLAHELSHALLYQNMSTLQKLRFPRWLLEGVATHTARQMGTPLYPTKEETYALIRGGNWMPPQYFETDKEDSIRIPPWSWRARRCGRRTPPPRRPLQRAPPPPDRPPPAPTRLHRHPLRDQHREPRTGGEDRGAREGGRVALPGARHHRESHSGPGQGHPERRADTSAGVGLILRLRTEGPAKTS